MLGDRKTAVLRGGAPWGFRLSGGIHTPVYISKVRSRSKAALAGLTTGDTLLSINGVSSSQKTLREVNDVIDTVPDQLILEVQSTTIHPRRSRLDSSSSLDTKENSPVRSIHRITPQRQSMDYQYNSLNTAPTYPSYTSTSGFNQYDNSRDQGFMDSFGRKTSNPLPAIFRTATVTSNSSSPSTKGQQFNYRSATSNNTYDTPRSYNEPKTSGYISDTNDYRRSTASFRSNNIKNLNASHIDNTNNQQQSYYKPSPTTYNTKIIQSNDQNYYSDSECVTSGPRYTKISRQINSTRRPSNIVLPIRSISSKAYDDYVSQEIPKVQQQPFDMYRYQQEQRERQRQEQLQRELYQQQQAAAARFKRPPQLTFPSQDQRRKSDSAISHEMGAELLKSPIPNKKRYADSSFFKTPYNTYPTIEEQKQLARKIAHILEGGDPAQKGTSKFEKQRQRAEKYAHETESTSTATTVSNYRPLRQLQTNDKLYFDTSNLPDCIKHSLEEAQHINPLRYVGTPEEFKQIHMQEHVTHTTVSPQAAMSLAAALYQNRGKGAALFQKRKARSEKWVIDENNVKKPGYQLPSNYIGPATKPWGQHAPSTWSADEKPYSGPSFSPIRPKFSVPSTPTIPESIFTPPPPKSVPRFGDFNAKPKGFNTRNTENITSQSPRTSIDVRKPLNLNTEPSIAESHTSTVPQPWSPPLNSQSMFSPNQQQDNDYFKYPSTNVLGKWKNQEYSPWNQLYIEEHKPSQIPMTREGVDYIRQRLMQQNQSVTTPQYKTYNQYVGNSANHNLYTSSQGSKQQQHFTDL
ncbi:unnamed protein product [Rotaria sp. Silwood2]|nr:unnamed protein product [Rotaria sp. Silwood2]CAF2717251.1 unnamed protein product [Rotaria sp. Silwood2]CAF3136261.1 unnamed protein product [Rotaria sp. Silwood2]CAF4163772.1 unnamed protein product [Rotaria sp. Silwood2]CAF4368376.1 unnamed protein product [Rotaria sp. Silwood2]